MGKSPCICITGASSGIGRAIGMAFSDAGYPVALLARRIAPMNELGLPNSLSVACDVREYESMSRAVQQVETELGPLDCMVNCAGVSGLARLDEQDPDEWNVIIQTNCVGVLNGMRAVTDRMKARHCGTIINLSSIAGRKVYAFHDVYGATKHFVHAVSEGVRQTMAEYGVRVMVVSPGVVKSDIEKTITNQAAYRTWSAGRDAIDGGIEAADVARAILFAYQLPQSVNIQELTITHTQQVY